MSDMGVGEAMLLSSIIGGGASIAGGALSNKTTQTSSPTMDPTYGPLQSRVLQIVQDRLNNPLPAGYEAQGVKATNAGYDAAKAATDASLTARGLATSPVAVAADKSNTLARAGAVGQFRATLPIVAREQQAQDLGLGGNLLGLGRGVTSTGTGGGGAAGAFTNLAGYLGYLSGKGFFKQAPLPGQNVPGFNASGVY